MNEFVPRTQSIADVYPAETTSDSGLDIDQVARWTVFLKRFKEIYDDIPEIVARSPGRVNIIGEHIDYSLYDVLPAALRVDVLIGVRAYRIPGPDGIVKLANFNATKFPGQDFSVPGGCDVEFDINKHEWANYFKAGMRIALHFLRAKSSGNPSPPLRMKVLVDGNVPPGGGVSSSAALICASALATVKTHGYNLSKQELLDLSLVSERSVGVYSGGMDQSASVFCRSGYLLYTQFYPTYCIANLPIPKSKPEITFLVAQSFVISNKADTAPTRYNLRVAECTLAALVLAKLHKVTLSPDTSPLNYCLRSFHQELMQQEGRLNDPLEYQLDSIISGATKLLKQDKGYTREEIAKILEISVPDLESTHLSAFPVKADRFYLRQRALHCFKEARRVIDFTACLTKSDHIDNHRLKYLGQLMNESQESCRTLYDCSCPEINEMCKIARDAGALGSRLTGAGWGGCTVNMIPQTKVESVISALKKKYYEKRSELTEEQMKVAMVISKPSTGAFVIHGSAITDILSP
ncbi:galactokinase [Ophidiomyces ophidiicola]|uniref:Galactokinase n=1 Tax=Ophidiomyces ophidiicola TaxID=1387563 RepID=A0ACB8V6G7_9EURO|nr:galactokinase [Ophidiomyces ophidiicola]KAI1906684.1 galactokinase [Ophidiomyces ophidiicola]KAI1923624.1 galactokinase [Ophidiomyces ophidiicola]KAI1925926.1 galactokinase [Ophidiomyces ophidiicola]KAI1939810.1 galactokinase [Ophidiomyces ophidiicola]KAI1956124.1 galactokinase [Ophidiomyces ophidiicola]